MAAKKKSKKKTTKRKSALKAALTRKFDRTRASIRRKFLGDAATHYRPDVAAMRAAIEELAVDDDFWETMEHVATHTAWRPSARRRR